MAGEEADEGSLVYTATWAIASVCAIFVLLSLLVERFISYIGHLLHKRKKRALYEALEKLKDELMLVGFVSLALAAGQNQILKICVPAKWADTMRLCPKPDSAPKTKGRRLATAIEQSCPQGETPFISGQGLHQLHILLFVLAVVHVAYSITIMALGIWKVQGWKAWEERATTKEDLSNHALRYTTQTTFAKAHGAHRWHKNPILGYLVAFFNQFFHSVTESDYHTLRHGFIKKHMPTNAKFDFHKYILRSLEEDFKCVINISAPLWSYAIFLLLINVNGWELHFWAMFIPIILVLIIGTKLQHILMEISIRTIEKHEIIEGMFNVMLEDDYFWFKRPQFVLCVIHFIMFQNAMELTFYIWATFTFPYNTCISKNKGLIICHLIIGVLTQLLCAYVTLPTYALVVQMGSHIKRSIFNEHIHIALHHWHRIAKNKLKESHDMIEDDNKSYHFSHAQLDDINVVECNEEIVMEKV